MDGKSDPSYQENSVIRIDAGNPSKRYKIGKKRDQSVKRSNH